MRQSGENISEHISFIEATKSATAKRNDFENLPNEKQLANMKKLAEAIFEPLRKGLGGFSINIASFFRSFLLNVLIGGAEGSQHLCDKGAAFDLDVDGSKHLYNYQIFNFIKDHLEFDQLIWEFGNKYNPDWVHVSFNEGKNRGQILVAYKENGRTKYKTYV